MPGLPKQNTFGLLTGMSGSSTQPLGSAKNDDRENRSIPICAPRGGNAGLATSGHSTGA